MLAGPNVVVQDRRFAMVYVAAEDLLHSFRTENLNNIVVTHPRIPSDARVLTVFWDYSRNAFGLLITHDSFPEVGPGSTAPVIDQLAKLQCVEALTQYNLSLKSVNELKALRERIDEIIYDKTYQAQN